MIDALRLATDNAVRMWTTLAGARGYAVIRRSGFIAIGGSDPAGLRIMTTTPIVPPDNVKEIRALMLGAPGRVVVEDSFSKLDVASLAGDRLKPRQMPVMVRPPMPIAAVPGDMPYRPARTTDDFRLAERLIVTGFPLEPFQPYQPGAAFPLSLRERDGVGLHLVDRAGTAVGACLTIADGASTGLYWVTTMPDHRSHGVGRALMHGVLGSAPQLPITLTASAAGRPLYDSLDFADVGLSTWWS